VAQPNRPLAFVAYLVPVVGPVLVLLLSRRNQFALYHASQSLALTASIVLAPLLWLVVGWLVVWLPLAGAVAAALFALVVAVYLAGVIAWLYGLMHSLRAEVIPLPVFGDWGERIYSWLAPA